MDKMSDNIKLSEVSEVLKMQLEGIDMKLEFDEVGTVLQVSDGVARIYGLHNAEANELLEFENGVMGVVMNLEEDNVGAVLLGATDRLKKGFLSSVRKKSRRSMWAKGCSDESSIRWVHRLTVRARFRGYVAGCHWSVRLRESSSANQSVSRYKRD